MHGFLEVDEAGAIRLDGGDVPGRVAEGDAVVGDFGGEVAQPDDLIADARGIET